MAARRLSLALDRRAWFGPALVVPAAALLADPVFRLTAINTALYTIVTVVLKLALGLGLALVLNQRFGGVRFWRSVLLLPYVVPTVLSAFAWWWIFDPQFSFISWTLVK